MKPIATNRMARFGLLLLTVATAHAGSELSPPDLAMVSLSTSKKIVNRMEPFKLTYTIKNVGSKAVANARISFTADYYPLSRELVIGALAAGVKKTGSIDMTVMKDSLMNRAPEPHPVHITYTATAQVIDGNGAVVPDINPGNDAKTNSVVTANPG